MLDIVFTESACGGLKMARSFGEGPYRGGCIGVILLRHKDGSEPTQAEIEDAQRQAEEKAPEGMGKRGPPWRPRQ